MKELIFYDTPLPFGKHKGELYGRTDPSYREWLKSNVFKYQFMDMTTAEYKERTKYWQVWDESSDVAYHRLNFSTKEEAIGYLERRYRRTSLMAYQEAIERLNTYNDCKWVWIALGHLM